jgi:hypothetical protein
LVGGSRRGASRENAARISMAHTINVLAHKSSDSSHAFGAGRHAVHFLDDRNRLPIRLFDIHEQSGLSERPPLAARPNAAMVVAGIAWDGATTNRPGSRFGPHAIRRASHMLCDGERPLFNVTAGASIAI